MLKGSDNQVAWAQNIRNTTIAQIDAMIPGNASEEQRAIAAGAMLAGILAIEEATWWIANQDKDFDRLGRAINRAVVGFFALRQNLDFVRAYKNNIA